LNKSPRGRIREKNLRQITKVSMMKVTINREECTSCSTCWETCPGFFEQNPADSFSQVMVEFRIADNPAEGTVPEDLEACVTEAADLCPVQIIRLD
jgi:ferredoxin